MSQVKITELQALLSEQLGEQAGGEQAGGEQGPTPELKSPTITDTTIDHLVSSPAFGPKVKAVDGKMSSKMSSQRTKGYTLRDIPDKLHHSWKLAVAHLGGGVTMNSFALAAIAEAVEATMIGLEAERAKAKKEVERRIAEGRVAERNVVDRNADV